MDLTGIDVLGSGSGFSERSRMDGAERGRGMWRNLKERLGLKGIGFCGSSLDLEPSNMNNLREDEPLGEVQEEEEGEPVARAGGLIPAETIPAPPCVGHLPATAASAGMNLATALAAERNPRPAGHTHTFGTPNLTTFRSLMRLFEETDGEDRKRRKRDKGGAGEGIDTVCCVCMERNKGAAFIPCGHTYCRVCSREVWLNRGSCPLCNRSITEILDIF